MKGCEMTVWGAFGGHQFNNKLCGEPCVLKSYFCFRHIGQLTEDQGKILRESRR